LDEETEGVKRALSSSFAKRKRFKSVSFGSSFYAKLALLSLFFCAFFVESYIESGANLDFQMRAYNFFYWNARADYQFFQAFNKIQDAFNTNTKFATTVVSGL